MKYVFLQRYPVQMGEFGIMLFMLVNALLEPIPKEITALLCRPVSMEKSIIP